MEPKWIVIEGPDGAGKSSIIEPLAQAIGGDVFRTREPGGCQTGLRIREILKDTELQRLTPPLARRMLFEADRICQQEQVRELLRRGFTVLQDRCAVVSNAAYAGAEGTGADLVQQLEAIDPDRLLPDLVIFLDAPIEVLRSRLKSDGPDPVERDTRMFERVVARYKDMIYRNNYALQWPCLLCIGERTLLISIVSSNQPIEAVVTDCLVEIGKAFA